MTTPSPKSSHSREPNGIEICRLLAAGDHEDLIRQIVPLHIQSLDLGITHCLGEQFVEQYYREIIKGRSSMLLVALSGRRVAGFLAGALDRHDFEQHRGAAARGLILKRMLTLRLSPARLLRVLRKRRLSRGFTQPSELLAIVVDPECRRGGVGQRLLEAWKQEVRAAGLREFLVFTDNEPGRQFYLKRGGECLFTFRLCGVTSAAFCMSVAKQPADAGEHGKQM